MAKNCTRQKSAWKQIIKKKMEKKTWKCWTNPEQSLFNPLNAKQLLGISLLYWFVGIFMASRVNIQIEGKNFRINKSSWFASQQHTWLANENEDIVPRHCNSFIQSSFFFSLRFVLYAMWHSHTIWYKFRSRLQK